MCFAHDILQYIGDMYTTNDVSCCTGKYGRPWWYTVLSTIWCISLIANWPTHTLVHYIGIRLLTIYDIILVVVWVGVGNKNCFIPSYLHRQIASLGTTVIINGTTYVCSSLKANRKSFRRLYLIVTTTCYNSVWFMLLPYFSGSSTSTVVSNW